MAPVTKQRPSAKDDDFVLTLSDDENDRFDEPQDEDDTSMSSSKKRKREAGESAAPKNKKVKQQQQGKQQKGKKGKQASTEEEDRHDDEEEEEQDAGEDDGALDSEFEFDVGGVVNQVVEFDGWGGNGEDGDKKNGNKKAVDIDDIIERRREKREKKAEKEKKKQLDESEDEKDEDEDDAMSVDFGDDELLAKDGFGMGADGVDEEEEEEAEGDDESDDEDEEEGEDDDDDAASDNDSVATPVHHPDDEASEPDSDAESEVDAEEEAKRKAFFAPEEKTNEDAAANGAKRSFQEFNLSRPILRGLAAVNFTNPTPIQQKTIPVALLGKDIVGSAVTGSGKTAAFVVPILERLLFRPRKVPTSRVAILMPTRELAVQCYNVATKLATYTDITFCQLVGGFSLREQENILKKRPDVIIATPGRFIDHMRNSASFTVDTLEILVLDEADRMLEDGFADELNEILTTIPKSRQTMLFSATMTDSVDKLIRVGLNRPVRLMVDTKKNTAVTLVQEFVRLRPGREDKRLGYLLHLCKEVYTGRVIVFFRQKKEAHRVRIVFGLLGLKAAELHGSMSQEQVSPEGP
jgi:ATP-dependent RNA helicase DDX27